MTRREYWTYTVAFGLLMFGVGGVIEAGWSVRTALAFVPFLLALPFFVAAHRDGERRRRSGEVLDKMTARKALGWDAKEKGPPPKRRAR